MIVVSILFAVAGLLAVTFVGGLPLDGSKR